MRDATRAAELAMNLAEVKALVAEAARAAGRDPASVELVAVSKTFPAQDVAFLAAAGQRAFGESYVQEALPKIETVAAFLSPALAPAPSPALATPAPVSWHFIGRLQKNKARQVCGRFDLIHSVDSPELARRLHQCMSEPGLAPGDRAPQPVLIQVNLAGESQKAGAGEAEAASLARLIVNDLPGLRLDGLMILPPSLSTGGDPRPWFARLRDLRDTLAAELGQPLPQLSMGMSGDFPAAIAEGATLVRVGTSLFGGREKR